MKKLLFACIIGLAGCVPACTSAPAPEMTNTIEQIETLPTGECIYYVVDMSDTSGYTFIDSCGKYKVGEQF